MVLFFFYLLLIAYVGGLSDINQLVQLHACFNFLKEITEQKKIIIYKHTYACALLSLTIYPPITFSVRFSLLLYKKKIKSEENIVRTDFFLYIYRKIIHHHPFSSSRNLFLNHVFDRFLFSCSSAAYRNG